MVTSDQFAQLFTREALRPFQPQKGSHGLTPMLVIYTPTEALVFLLALDDFNDWGARRGYVHGLGQTCAQRHAGVEVVQFGSEAWLRTFTPEEAAARGTRLVETYPDKQEGIIVFGQQAEGPLTIAQALLYRRPSGRIERLGDWNVVTHSEAHRLRSPLLDAFWEGYACGKRDQN